MLSFLTEYLKYDKYKPKYDFVNIESLLKYRVSLELSELIQVPLIDERSELSLGELSNSPCLQPTTRIKMIVTAIRFFIIKELGYSIPIKNCTSVNQFGQILLQLTARQLREFALPAKPAGHLSR